MFWYIFGGVFVLILLAAACHDFGQRGIHVRGKKHELPGAPEASNNHF